MRTDRSQVSGYLRQFTGPGLSDHLCLRELQKMSDADVRIVLERDLFGISESELRSGMRR